MTNSNIAVSVIIPVFNVEKYLDDAIQSVLAQSLQNFEIILVNDGSSDSSLEICTQYTLNNQRIQLINQKNAGVSIARNNGLLLARGEYVFFMDSDDTIDPNFLLTSYTIAIEEQSDIVILGDYYCQRTTQTAALPTCAQFIRASFLHQHSDIRFPEKIQPCEDGLFSHQLLAFSKKNSLNPLAIYFYRSHDNQNHKKIQENYDAVIEQIPKWFEILKAFYLKNNLIKSHALHLALFLEHEPFELRYLSYDLNEIQKTFLYNIIKEFYDEFVFPYIKRNEMQLLGRPFRAFVSSKNHAQFDYRYNKLKKEKKIKLKLINLIPVKKIRKKLRASVEKTSKII